MSDIFDMRPGQISAFNNAFEREMDRMIMQMSCDPPILTYIPEPLVSPAAPCQGCGSRETIVHNGRSRCAYCRGDR